MINYDLLILSPDEFENLSRDLLQREFSLFFESFTTGRDDGVDFRCARNNQNIVLQCKRYDSWDNLKSNLKKESKKAVVKKASRYILTTTVKLTPRKKEEIKNIFHGSNITESDIFGYHDIINLLSKNNEIENKYYKLWLCNTKVIERILHANIINQSDFEREKIENSIKIFVPNESVNQSLDILNRLNFVIISGIPGIGKTSLARHLAYYYLSPEKGYEDFIYITESISEGFTLYKKNKKQIFLFDDFLGSRFLISNIEKNEDKKLVDFIEYIQKDNNKKLIFTTREYILNQANNELERLKAIGNNCKCVVDLSSYTKFSKAKILYNHLFWNNVPVEYINSLLKNKTYKQIINHNNYSPRLIESITKKNILQQITCDEYADMFIKYLDNPTEIWDFSFTKHISEIARSILIIAATTDTPVLASDLLLAVDKYRGQIYNKEKINKLEFNNALKELDDTFIKTSKTKEGETLIRFHNPSIMDYLTNFLSDNPEIVSDLIKSAYFFNQYFADYSTKKDPHKIFISPSTHKELVNQIASDFKNNNVSTIKIISDISNSCLVSYCRQEKSIIATLSFILRNRTICDYDISKIPIEESFNQISCENVVAEELEDYIYILKYIIEKRGEHYNLREIFDKTFTCVGSISDLLVFCQFKEIEDSVFGDTINSHIDEISDIVDEDIGNATPDQYDEIEELISILSSKTGYDFDKSIEQLNELRYDYDFREPDEDDLIRYKENAKENQDAIIDNMFDSLSYGE